MGSRPPQVVDLVGPQESREVGHRTTNPYLHSEFGPGTLDQGPETNLRYPFLTTEGSTISSQTMIPVVEHLSFCFGSVPPYPPLFFRLRIPHSTLETLSRHGLPSDGNLKIAINLVL